MSSSAAAQRVPRSVEPFRFLLDALIDRDTLEKAAQHAARLGLPLQRVLIAEALVPAEAYVAELARHLGVPALLDTARTSPRAMLGRCVFIDGETPSPDALRFEIAACRRTHGDIVLVTRAELQRLGDAQTDSPILERAVSHLLRKQPELSAGTPIWTWQVMAVTVLSGLAVGGALVMPGATMILVSLLIAFPFLIAVAFRLVTLTTFMVTTGTAPPEPMQCERTGAAEREVLSRADDSLPVYSILVPLFRESAVLPDLVRALSRMDYPAAKLDVILILEGADLETRRVAAALRMPAYFRIVIVPDAEPRTKPKALNYALAFARGDYVAVYDAEDEPDPRQLRRALAVFDAEGSRCWCVQAKLSIHNARASWLTRQFALEYTTLFDGLLPAVTRLGVPVPLGGTSNHFPRDVLDRLGGWDPHNVTEDVDLGVRLARAGGKVAMVESTTWEEAPVRFVPWLKQRTRWIKGWMQTYLVHTREPAKLLRDLGGWGCLGFHALVGGLILSALVHPIFYMVAILDVVDAGVLLEPRTPLETALWVMAAFNLLAGYLAATLLAAMAIVRRGRLGLSLHVLAMPVYWLLISLAAYRALFQLVTAPYRWEKTEHHGRRSRGGAKRPG